MFCLAFFSSGFWGIIHLIESANTSYLLLFLFCFTCLFITYFCCSKMSTSFASTRSAAIDAMPVRRIGHRSRRFVALGLVLFCVPLLMFMSGSSCGSGADSGLMHVGAQYTAFNPTPQANPSRPSVGGTSYSSTTGKCWCCLSHLSTYVLPRTAIHATKIMQGELY